MPNPASSVQSLRCNTGLVANGRRDRRTHDDSIYRASIATSGKNLYELRMSLSKRANAHANLVGLNLLNSGLFCFKVWEYFVFIDTYYREDRFKGFCLCLVLRLNLIILPRLLFFFIFSKFKWEALKLTFRLNTSPSAEVQGIAMTTCAFCMFVFVRWHMSKTRRPTSPSCQWMARSQHCCMLRTSGFVDDVMFIHNRPN